MYLYGHAYILGFHDGIWGVGVNRFSTLPFEWSTNRLVAKYAPFKMQSFYAIKKVANSNSGVEKKNSNRVFTTKTVATGLKYLSTPIYLQLLRAHEQG